MKAFTVQNQIALLTKHDKQKQIAPVFKRAFGTDIATTDKFDTDTLGTFDGSTSRELSPAKCAIKKAHLACKLTGLSQGLGSEGSFHSHFVGGTIDEEVIAFVDIRHNLEIVAFANKVIGLSQIEAKNIDDLRSQLASVKTSNSRGQKWIYKLSNRVYKGKSTENLIDELGELTDIWPLDIDPDFRAMHCPERQQVIASASEDLVMRLSSSCPKCQSVDFVDKYPKDGPDFLRCELCGTKTHVPQNKQKYCYTCGHQEQHSKPETTTSSFNCPLCNP